MLGNKNSGATRRRPSPLCQAALEEDTIQLINLIYEKFGTICSFRRGGHIEPIQFRNEDRDLSRWAGWNLGNLFIVVRIFLSVNTDESIPARHVDLLCFSVV